MTAAATDASPAARDWRPETELNVLRARSEALARRAWADGGTTRDDPLSKERAHSTAEQAAAHPVDHLGFACAGGRYLIEAAFVSEVIPVSQLPPLAPVPGRPSGVAGLCNVRGRVVPVFRFHDALDAGAGHDARPGDSRNAWLLVLDDDADGRVGVLVDAIEGVEPLLESCLRSVPPGLVPPVDRLACARRAVTEGGVFVLSGKLLLEGPALRAGSGSTREDAP